MPVCENNKCRAVRDIMVTDPKTKEKICGRCYSERYPEEHIDYLLVQKGGPTLQKVMKR